MSVDPRSNVCTRIPPLTLRFQFCFGLTGLGPSQDSVLGPDVIDESQHVSAGFLRADQQALHADLITTAIALLDKCSSRYSIRMAFLNAVVHRHHFRGEGIARTPRSRAGGNKAEHSRRHGSHRNQSHSDTNRFQSKHRTLKEAKRAPRWHEPNRQAMRTMPTLGT